MEHPGTHLFITMTVSSYKSNSDVFRPISR